MAAPPATYPALGGNPCGSAWNFPEEVTGQLPNKNFGWDYAVQVPPLFEDREAVLASGSDRNTQIAVMNVLANAIANLRQLVADSTQFIGGSPPTDERFLTTRQAQSIEWLLLRAEALATRANMVWEQWENRTPYPWPLSEGDTGCDYLSGICCGLEPGTTGTVRPIGVGDPFKITCPTTAEILRRKSDRSMIAPDLGDALAHVFCAQCGFWRVKLYRQALKAWKAIPANMGPGSFAAPGAGPPPVAPPSDPSDIPDPGDLPDPSVPMPDPIPVPSPPSDQPSDPWDPGMPAPGVPAPGSPAPGSPSYGGSSSHGVRGSIGAQWWDALPYLLVGGGILAAGGVLLRTIRRR